LKDKDANVRQFAQIALQNIQGQGIKPLPP
jgi:hypothetical protein